MRKLLVASQKGGVGKTTTAMNLAAATAMAGARVLLLDADPLSSVSMALNLHEHPHRQPLRTSGIDLPGVLVSGVVPGLDVLSPYEEGACLDEDLDDLLNLLSTPAFRSCYGCLIVNTPPFLGANPSQLATACDELLLVMRAEPMAARTLPAFLELVQRSRREQPSIPLRGILLTLPEGEDPGCRWERELRGRFGNRILSQVVPFDEEFGKAQLEHQVPAHANPASAAAATYHNLIETLSLAEEAKEVSRFEDATLPVLVSAGAATLDGIARRRAAHSAAAAAVTTLEEPKTLPPAAEPEPLEETPEAIEPPAPLAPVVPTRTHGAPSGRVPRLPAAALTPPALKPAAPQPSAPKTPAVKTPVPAAGGYAAVWIVVAAAIGIGLRFVQLPASALPVIVGMAVGAGAVVVLRVLSTPTTPRGKQVPTATTAPPTPAPAPSAPTSTPRTASKKDAGSRLAAITRRSSPPKRDGRR